MKSEIDRLIEHLTLWPFALLTIALLTPPVKASPQSTDIRKESIPVQLVSVYVF